MQPATVKTARAPAAGSGVTCQAPPRAARTRSRGGRPPPETQITAPARRVRATGGAGPPAADECEPGVERRPGSELRRDRRRRAGPPGAAARNRRCAQGEPRPTRPRERPCRALPRSSGARSRGSRAASSRHPRSAAARASRRYGRRRASGCAPPGYPGGRAAGRRGRAPRPSRRARRARARPRPRCRRGLRRRRSRRRRRANRLDARQDQNLVAGVRGCDLEARQGEWVLQHQRRGRYPVAAPARKARLGLRGRACPAAERERTPEQRVAQLAARGRHQPGAERHGADTGRPRPRSPGRASARCPRHGRQARPRPRRPRRAAAEQPPGGRASPRRTVAPPAPSPRRGKPPRRRAS